MGNSQSVRKLFAMCCEFRNAKNHSEFRNAKFRNAKNHIANFAMRKTTANFAMRNFAMRKTTLRIWQCEKPQRISQCEISQCEKPQRISQCETGCEFGCKFGNANFRKGFAFLCETNEQCFVATEFRNAKFAMRSWPCQFRNAKWLRTVCENSCFVFFFFSLLIFNICSKICTKLLKLKQEKLHKGTN